MEQTSSSLAFEIQLIQCFEITKDYTTVSNPVYNIQNYIGLKLLPTWATLTSLDLIIIFKIVSIHLSCTCSSEVESTAQFFLHWHHYCNIKAKLLNIPEVIDVNFLKLSEEHTVNQSSSVQFLSTWSKPKQKYFEFFNRLASYSRIKAFWKALYFKVGINFCFSNYLLSLNISSFQILPCNKSNKSNTFFFGLFFGILSCFSDDGYKLLSAVYLIPSEWDMLQCVQFPTAPANHVFLRENHEKTK